MLSVCLNNKAWCITRWHIPFIMVFGLGFLSFLRIKSNKTSEWHELQKKKKQTSHKHMDSVVRSELAKGTAAGALLWLDKLL